MTDAWSHNKVHSLRNRATTQKLVTMGHIRPGGGRRMVVGAPEGQGVP
jgi:hypothetical protein